MNSAKETKAKWCVNHCINNRNLNVASRAFKPTIDVLTEREGLPHTEAVSECLVV
jgi:hypothetical protein